ncbi:MAG: AbrB/MazE/SpoVT family DNA-binding domain-containing protein [Bacteroidota bacterium]
MYVNTLSISPRGQIVLPEKVRNALKSEVISLEINEQDQVLVSPVRNLGGSLSSYQKDTPLSFDMIRQQAWEDNISVAKKHKVGKR